MRRPLLPRGDTRDRGAAAVEFALVAPILLWLVFGIIDYGVWFADGLSTRDAARSAARAASMGLPITSPSCATVNTGWTGLSGDDFTKRVACTAAASQQLMGSKAYYKVTYTATPPNRGDLVLVCIATKQSVILPLVPLPNGGVQITKMAYPIEVKDQLNSSASGQNVDPTGGSWSWCT